MSAGRPTSWRAELALAGPGGEPVDLRRTISSHGLAALPPMRPLAAGRALELTLAMPGSRPRVARIAERAGGRALVTVSGRAPGRAGAAHITAAVRHVLALDRDLSGFYALAAGDPELAWVCAGAGRMIRSPTVFEDVVKTICTTNCAWSATERMIGAIVEHLGEPAVDAPPAGPWRRAFPAPQAMAAAGEAFYRDVARAGYRGRSLLLLAEAVASGALDLEALGRARPDELPDAELEAALLALPGVGPYAATHVMLLLGRSSRLILDSWTRPSYARLVGRPRVADRTIERRFRRYGPWAGLAFWLALTRGWVVADEALPTDVPRA
jgi:3-methyladenine DNA glycosylase/8-oxoguanine DNA glycosylase